MTGRIPQQSRLNAEKRVKGGWNMKKLVMLALALLLALSCTAYAEGVEVKENTLTATGSGVVYVESDVATVSLGVMEYSTDVKEAQNTVNTKIAAVRAALLEAGVENSDINTDSIYIYANYDYSGDTQRVVGYTATNSLSVRTTEIDKVGALIDAAFAAGANQLNNVEFSKQDISEAQDQALTMATQNAIAKAKTIASAAGVQLNGIAAISENNSYYYDSGLNVTYARTEDVKASEGTDVQAAMISVSAFVTIEYRIAE